MLLLLVFYLWIKLFMPEISKLRKNLFLAAQVVGRCGRGEKSGRAYLQTFMPDHYVLNLAAKQDYEAFYKEEILIRKALLFPPVCDICVLGINSEDDEKAKKRLKKFLKL